GDPAAAGNVHVHRPRVTLARYEGDRAVQGSSAGVEDHHGAVGRAAGGGRRASAVPGGRERREARGVRFEARLRFGARLVLVPIDKTGGDENGQQRQHDRRAASHDSAPSAGGVTDKWARRRRVLISSRTTKSHSASWAASMPKCTKGVRNRRRAEPPA